MSRPRIRTIKPDMWADERVGCVSRDARLLFVTLITLADDEGRLRELPAAIIGSGFPYDEDAPSLFVRWLEQLAGCGLVRRYSVAGSRYIALPGWARHQVINRPKPSELPGPPDNGPIPQPPDRTSPVPVSDASVTNHGASTSRKGREGRGKETLPNPPTSGRGPDSPVTAAPPETPGLRSVGTNPRRRGTNPRALGTNPRRLGGQAAAAVLRDQAHEAAATLAVPDTTDRLRWQRLRTAMRAAVKEPAWSTWVGRLELAGLKDDTLVLDAPDHAWFATGRVSKLIDACADSTGVRARIATTAEHDGLVA